MELKVLLQEEDQIQIKNVKILGEDENSYRISVDGLKLPFVKKDLLYQNVCGNVFGFEIEKMIESWNGIIKRQIEYREKELNRLKNSILHEDFNESVYKIEG